MKHKNPDAFTIGFESDDVSREEIENHHRCY